MKKRIMMTKVAYIASEAGESAMRKVRYRPYNQCDAPGPPADGLWKLLGCVLISAGLLLLFLCIPGWAWAALAGMTLVCAGWAIISTCRR